MPPIHPLLSLPLEVGETPASYVSRLVWQMRVAARAFCLDLGVNFQQVVDGEPEALARLAEALGLEAGQLSSQALVRKETGYRILLHDPPFIAPLIGRNDLELAMAFSRHSLEEFRERLYGNATSIRDPGEELVSVREAARRLNCSNLEILELMLDRRIETFRAGDELRFESLRVNQEEVRPFIHTSEAPELTPRELEVALNTATRVAGHRSPILIAYSTATLCAPCP